MSRDLILSNARVVTRTAVIEGSVCVENGLIRSVDDGASTVSSTTPIVDFAGDYLLPGLIEIHTDNVEKHFAPRPTVIWPAPMFLRRLLTLDAHLTPWLWSLAASVP